jgi:hypothetical protein
MMSRGIDVSCSGNRDPAPQGGCRHRILRRQCDSACESHTSEMRRSARTQPALAPASLLRCVLRAASRWMSRLAVCSLCVTLFVVLTRAGAANPKQVAPHTVEAETLESLFRRTTQHLRAREVLLRRNASRLVVVTTSKVRALPAILVSSRAEQSRSHARARACRCSLLLL